MEAYSSSSSRTKSNSPVFPNYFQRSVSPSGHFCSSSRSSSNSMFSSSQSSSVLTRPTSPSRVNLRGSVSPTSSSSSSIRFSTSPSRSTTFSNHKQKKNNNNNKEWSSRRGQKKTCMCSPTTHPGSFRCSLHKSVEGSHRRHQHQTVSYRLDARRSAMTNSLVRIGTVEGDLVKRALAVLIRPSSHQQKRRADFRPRPTRLSVMSKPQDV